MTARRVLGVDPGAQGAAVLLEAPATTLDVYDFHAIGFEQLCGLLRAHVRPLCDVAVLELASAMPARRPGEKGQGVSSAYNFGHARGEVHGALVANGFRIFAPRPSVWKARMGLPADKAACVAKALLAFPDLAPHLRGPRGGIRDGVAEAAFLALFGLQYLDKRNAMEDLVG